MLELQCSATAVAIRQAWLAIHIRPEFVYREALAMIRRSQAVIDHLGTPYPSAVPLRTYNLDGGNFFPVTAVQNWNEETNRIQNGIFILGVFSLIFSGDFELVSLSFGRNR